MPRFKQTDKGKKILIRLEILKFNIYIKKDTFT